MAMKCSILAISRSTFSSSEGAPSVWKWLPSFGNWLAGHLVEALYRILPHEDAEMLITFFHSKAAQGQSLFRHHRGFGIGVGRGFTIKLSNGVELTPDTILQAVGRRFNTEGLASRRRG